MSLRTQLFTTIILLFVLFFAGTLFLSIQSSQDYLQNQLKSQADEVATSLGLSFTSAVDLGDESLLETMVNSAFDSGDYLQIRIENNQDAVLVERSLEVVVDGVPPWFIEAFPLETPIGHALLTSGWSQLGHIYIQNHPGYAYADLWRKATQSSSLFILLTTIASIAMLILLRVILRPLNDIEKQAAAVTQKKFIITDKLPKARELRQVAKAMNQMVERLQQIFENQAALNQEIRREAYEDGVTKLPNRRYFNGQLDTFLNDEESASQGIYIQLQILDLDNINQQHGYQITDELLQTTSKLLQESIQHYPKAQLFRFSGSEFSALLPNTTTEQAEPLALEITNKIATLRSMDFPLENDFFALGMLFHIHNQEINIGSFLGSADNALQSARAQHSNGWHLLNTSETDTAHHQGAQHWKAHIEQCLTEKNLEIYLQPVVSTQDRTLVHYEVLARMPSSDGETLPGGSFIPMAERFGLMPEIDRIIILNTLELASSKAPSANFSINLSSSSTSDPEFIGWLEKTLNRFPGAAKRISLEVSEGDMDKGKESIRPLADRLDEIGSSLSLDHFGVGFTSFGYLTDLRARYVKIDRSHIQDIHQQKESRFFVHSLADIAHGLGIQVIAEGVENQQQIDTLKDFPIDGLQGYFIAKPLPAEEALLSFQ
ncbi:MAG: EAL domain-containing protein [Gammaproteobacteria bacterium]|jgi:diguanylate cyclase (GGDEF)-like protein|nr:EAL domain-containing protein [Gammaproteobacteria bacterium]MBT3488861.1 EAL domain-containing protein [Gammaproteobacteria bacterium]MBT3719546.1 EAL domain-containing protein [Gammaproteobacteria bacterium]MBT3844507.1 EAL domain-containing protein [Gammaproteobacteria bacterium]MBT3891961.1 EAL domain-containing protein [Gammaproteobacteria bacterium]